MVDFLFQVWLLSIVVLGAVDCQSAYTLELDHDNRLLVLHGASVNGTACLWNFDANDASVICRQSGYGQQGTFFTLPHIGIPHALFNVRCNGTESSIDECGYDTYDQFHVCYMMGDIGIECTTSPTAGYGGQADVTIGPGGRVFALTMNGTGTVCGDQWDDSDADVVCRQMGFPSGTATQLPRDYMYNHHIFNVRCMGNESQVQQCPVDESDIYGICSMYGDAGVSCSNVTMGPMMSMSFAHDGRVLAHNYNGTGTVCGEMWDDNDAGVLCRQLGFASGSAILLPRDPVFNRFYFNVNCFGNETDVQSCHASTYDISGMCGYFEDAGVVCNGMPSGGQADVTIGPGGRVFALTMNGTGTVCGDQWDDSDADVVCRQMGFPSGTATQLPRDYMYNHHIFNVRCMGNESQVQQCPVDESDIYGICSMYGDAGVSCSNVTMGPMMSMSFAHDGRVLAHNYNGTGTVCGEMWDDNDAGVLCRQMGFASGSAILLPRDPVFNRFYFNVNCFGNETDVQSCHASTYDISGMCGYFEDAGVVCNGMPSGGQADVTIGPGGRVFAHTMNGTGTVCGDQWDDSDADVVCRQMGFPSGTATQLPRDYMYNHHIFNVRCMGNESQVQQCPVDESDIYGICSMYGDAGVSCSNVTMGPMMSMSFAHDGRVLAHNNNGTGTVCGEMWDDNDAGVLCRQMGFASGSAILLPRDPVFNRFYFNVNCFGNETDVQSCHASTYDISGMCGYFEDAGVVCNGMPSGGQADVTIGPGGRVFAHTMNGTGTVCGDQWDDSDADVVCRQMGFPSGTATQLPRDYMYNHHIFNVRCMGNESQVQQCPVDESDIYGICSMYGDAGVSCSNVTMGPMMSMSFAHDGRVLAHNNNGTGTVCGEMWDENDAGVLCRQMGFASGSAILLPRDPVFNRFYFNVNCFGNETDVQSCHASTYDISGMCGYFEDAGVVCNGMPSGGQADVTIGPGGRVFAHTMNGTGTVCGDQWDDSDADVVCRQMGFPSGTATQLPRDYMYNHHIFNVRCMGNESQVQQCPVDESDIYGICSMYGDAGVSCSNVTMGPMMSMSFAHDGRVLAHNNNGTGTVCGEMWDDNDAGVLCRQMGFASGSAILLPRDPVFNRFYFNVNCFGNETDVQSCHASTYDISGMCGYFEDAGVVCNGMPSGGQADVTIGPGGRVFAHTMNGTGTVCGDQWDDSDADVVCRQMGFPSGTATQLPRDYMYNHHIFNVRCMGNESQVQQCPVDESDIYGICSMYGDAGVSCSNVTMGPMMSMSFAHDGRVLAHNNNGTGTVCGEMWDDNDAGVLCRQMGFASGSAILLPRDPVFNRFYFNVNCFGNETDVQSCHASTYDISGMCGYFEDAGVVCNGMPSGGQADVTIGPGGRVFAHTMNGTGTVCGDQWDDSDADVVCRQMGFPSGTATQLPRDYMYNHHIFNVRCMGNESQVQQCPVDESDIYGICSMYGDAGVSCSNVTMGPMMSMSFAHDGRVLAHNNNGTGTVCGEMWDDNDAGVLCRQMGFASGSAILLPRDPVFNRFYFNVNCFGNETDVQSCHASTYDISGMCGYFEDAGVVCNGMPSGGQADVTIGPGGRVFAHTMNGTGTVCGDQWDDSDADVVCRQMGFPSGTATQLPRDYMYNHHIFNVRCMGNESQVQQCPVDESDIYGICSMYGDAGVSCSNVTMGPMMSMSFAHDGRVLAHNNNGTGTVCGEMWDDNDAGVLCRQMGFASGSAILLPRDPVFNRFYFNVNCFGNETDVQSCHASTYDISGMCGYFEDAGVVCNGMPSGGQADVTIGPGGRVFAHTMNGTGTVCGDQWDDSDADVVCRQMGFPSGTATQLPRDYMYNHHIFNVRCMGNESQVQQCPVDESDIYGICSMYGDAGVSCSNVTMGPMMSMSFAHDGRVLAHNNNGTGTVCGEMWDDNDAGVLCRQMGFASGSAILLPRDPVFNRFYFNVNCFGNETDVQSCHASTYDISGMCGYFEDAGVVCNGMPSGGQADVTIGPGGRVFAHTMNGTGTVCGDQWDDSDADVVCRQMGFPSGTATQLPRDYMYNHHIFNVRCMGNESQVQQCPVDESDIYGICSMYGDAGVSCSNVTMGPMMSMSFAHDGRVLAHNNNGTGTVCGEMWDDNDAGVLCRQMGFASGSAILLPRDPVFNRFYFNVNCFGNETDVQSCHASTYDISGMCGYFEDAGVVCNGMPSGGQADVTIGPGGRVFAHTMNGTGTVCGDQWDDSDADVVCRQMGFPSGTATQLPRDYMYNHHIFNVRCMGNESQVQQCPVDESDIYGICSMYGDAGVSCSNVTMGPMMSMSFAHDGRVLAHNNNGTGTVCGEMWDDNDAGVLCRQMGFASGSAILLPRDPVFNRFYFNVNCFGNETDVQSCHASTYDISGMCGYFEDAGVVCNGMPSGGQADVTIGPGGRVFAHTMNGTGTVCGDQWDDSDADVVCRQMGFPSGTATQLPRDYMYNHHIFNVRCMGNESQVQQCPVDESDIYGICSMYGDAGVSCSNVTMGPMMSMSFAHDGRVLAHNNNGTGTVCGEMWDDNDAGVLCRQMGFASGSAILLPRDPVFNRFYFNVNCFGNETDVQSCHASTYDISGMCGYFEDAGVVCNGMPSGGQADVTIGPGGRVFAHTMNGTGTVCGDQWDDSDADVVCRQMGFPSGTATQLPRDYMYNHHIFNVRCMGNESQVQQCPVDESDIYGICSMYGDAGVSCSNVTMGPMMSMSFAHDGRVLAHNNNGTGTVCGEMWDDNDAGVLCRQMGFASGSAILLPRDPVFNRFYFNVNCFGNETDVQSCHASTYDISGMCGYFEDAGVVCNGMPSGGQADVTIGPGGRVFAHTMNGTGTVCGDQWDDSDADVVCRQMGFPSGTATQLPRDYMYNHHIFNVRCMGNESQVQQCPVDESDIYGICSMYGDAGVSCSNVTMGPMMSMSFAHDGRVLAHNNNGTGTVCGEMWDDNDAGVLCRQMGFASGSAILLPRDPVFNRFYFNVNCFGNEIDVQSCHASTYDISGMCGYFEDAGVVCNGMPSGGQADVTIGPGGRVFALTMNGTGTVCGDQWDDSDADVVCRQMGFPSGTATQLPRDYMYNHHIFNVRCMGNESQVQQCPVDESDIYGICSMYGDAGVSCSNVTMGPMMSMSFAHDGRVLAHNYNGTGTVCGEMWDDNDAGVLCRQMGFASGSAILLPRDPVFNRFYFNVNCFGNETDVQSCHASTYDISGMCGYFEDAGVVCNGGQADVTIGPGGRVFAHTMNGTGTVCGDQWDDSDADVVCRQMGFPSGTATQLPRDYMYNHHIFNVRCMGNESQVQQCPVDESDIYGICSMYGDAGVSCSNVTMGPMMSMSFAHDGRVLAHNNNGTGTVCGEMWDDNDAGVLCRQMGFASGSAILLPRDPVFNRFYFNVNCFGNETDVQSCHASTYDISGMCGYFEDAGVVCNGMPSGGQADVTIGPGGRVFAHTMNGTGTVCGDQWDDSDADVVCRQMGFPSGTATQLPRDYMYNHHIFNVRCMGNESQVQQCPVDESDIYGICSMYGDAGVSCSNVTMGPMMSMSFAHDGRVLAHNNNGTGTVCGEMWDDNDAGVLCRQMGFASGSAILLPRDPVFNRFYFNVNCFGNETDVQSCHASTYDISGMCGYFEDAGVVCNGMPSGGQADVTIGPGGRVFAHTMNGTGTVCGDQWDDSDADVVCRQMGFPSGTATQLPRDYMYNHHIFNVRCMGNESQVQQCPVDESDIYGICSMYGDAGVSCSNVTMGPMMSMSFAHDGRVLAHNNNGTGTVCGEMWDDNDAGVLCRQMGFASGSAILLPRDPVFNRFYFNVNCFGNETDVQSCHASTYDISGMCGYFEDAGVVCNGMPSGGQADVTIGPGGRVFAHTMNGTGTVCGDQWDDSDADVVCRQMGFPSGTATQLPRDYMYNHHIFNVRCMGNESQVQQCPVDESDIYGICSMYGDAGVSCSNVTMGPMMSMSFAHDGRVLAHNNNGTGTVCGEMWDDNDAGVLCRQMGFASGSAILLPRDPVFNRFYFNVNCFGNETDVQSCHASTYDISGMCGYFEDAGVVCNGMPSGGQADVTIGPGGRVFAHTMNGTGTVCGDQWDDSDADVVCRQMGFPSGTATQLPRDYMYNHHIFNVRCMGNESQVQQCPVDESDIYGICSMYGDAGVSCSNVTMGPMMSMSFAHDGRVLAHNNNGTGTVCGEMWDDNDAGVLCRQMGFASGSAILLPRDPVFNRFYFNVNCFGNETDVQSCHASTYDISGMCGYFEDAGVVCNGMPSGGQADVMIGPGGRVFAHTMNGTGTVCGDQWDDSDADVVCRQMGFPSGTATQLSRDYMYNHHIFNVRCMGNESQVQQCPVDETDIYGSCSMYGDAGVSCSNGTMDLVNVVYIGQDGRVMASHNVTGYTGTVCGYLWDDLDADVLCQQFGFPSGTAKHMQRDYNYNRAIFNVQCTGMEPDIYNCPVEHSDISGNCPMADDAGVICENFTLPYPSTSSQYSFHSSLYSFNPTMSSSYSQYSMSSQYSQYPSMSSQYSQYSSMSSQYSQYPSVSSQYSQYPSVSSQYSQYPSMSSQYSQYPSMSSQYSQNPSMSSQYSQYPSMSSQYSQYPSMSSQYSQYPSMSSQYSQYPSVSSQYSQYPSMSSQYSQYPSMSSQYSQYPSMSSQYSQYPSMSSQYSQNPSMSSQYSQYPSVSSQYSQYPSMSSQYSQYPSISSQYSQFPSMSSQYSQYPIMSSQYSQYPSMSSLYSQYPSMSSQYSQYPSMSSQYSQYPSMSSQYSQYPSVSSQYSQFSSMSSQYSQLPTMSLQVTTIASQATSQASAGQTTTQASAGQTTTQAAQTTSQASAGQATTQASAGQTTQASAGQTTTQAPQTTTQASAGQTTTQAAQTTTQASVGQTTQASAGQTTTQAPQTTQASAGQTTTQAAQTTIQGSAGQTTMQAALTTMQAPQTTQASAGQTTTQAAQTTTQAPAGQTTTQAAQTTTQASVGQTTQASAGQTTTQAAQTTTQASAGQTTTQAAQTTTQASAAQTTDQTTSLNCQPGSGSCILQMDSLGGGAESRMGSHLISVMLSALVSIFCLVLMY
uniref:Uncharacterized protein LOC111119012 isoform X5 n=1 Tax=Crassostrea virginica TaxID=6565 RepID=A0A8B8CH40_CRAVI|nr:uncharacterized protein LOC111119012 isoform X5 [Crassostrea virginica]